MLAPTTHQLLSSELEVVQVVEAGSADHHRHLQLGLGPRLQPHHAVWKTGILPEELIIFRGTIDLSISIFADRCCR